MAKIKKTIRAGNLVKTTVYTKPDSRDGYKPRAMKSRPTTAARKRMNDKAAKGKLTLLMAANFAPNDWVVTLTYDDEHRPSSREEAESYLKKWIRVLRTLYEWRGDSLIYILVTGKPMEGVWNHHVMIKNSGKNDIETFDSLWLRGNVYLERVYEREFDQWAQYMTRESKDRAPGKQMWRASKGLLKPDIEICSVME